MLVVEQFVRFLIICIFISTIYSKVVQREKHIEVIRNYKIVVDKWIIPFFYLNISLEIIIVVGLATKLFVILSIVISLLLINMYTIAIIINLLRGRKNITCGCGGIVGDSSLSVLLVLRNGILLMLCGLALYINMNNSINYSIVHELVLNRTYIVLLMCFSLILLYLCSVELKTVYLKFKELSSLKS
ncbi:MULTISPECIES: MauE/DoxX family redox-associated membrane protein [Bacillus cereus group]|uniref:MauE/DoxX family redox-associated membrane protein n=1 Tax=Bacillus cereus group TaxID=86661 RepID=UPI000992D16A|nr:MULTISPECIES: MauE/DoxX family redox-associated membrane protein [Bacillus cereus group]MED1436324.1 MauE/DoxX family redox-associated membrane protein [Bacillus mycoides]OOQ91985.1 hypothetical protein BW898_26345 [Bacillus cereus]QWG87543.1 hypothetical protein EXW61_30155 [Bacillus mycoides]